MSKLDARQRDVLDQARAHVIRGENLVKLRERIVEKIEWRGLRPQARDGDDGRSAIDRYFRFGYIGFGGVTHGFVERDENIALPGGRSSGGGISRRAVARVGVRSHAGIALAALQRVLHATPRERCNQNKA